MDRFLEKDFEGVTKDAWIEKLIKDLKGKDIKDFYDDTAQIKVDPFAMHSDIPEQLGALSVAKDGWWSVVRFNHEDNARLPQEILDYLKMGMEGLQLTLNGQTDLSALYKDIYPDMIYNDLAGISIDQFHEWISKTKNPNAINGCLNLDPDQDFGALIYPNFHYYKLKEENTGDVEKDMLLVISKLIRLLEIKVNISQVQISLGLGHNILHNIVRIRTYRMIVANLLDHYQLPQSPVFISADLDNLLDGEDENQQLIIATTAAVSAVTAGIDMMSLIPSKGNGDEAARLGLNIQLMLKMESQLDGVGDPLSGSYVIENSCAQLAQNIWDKI